MNYLFDDLSKDTISSSPCRAHLSGGTLDDHGDQLSDPMVWRETLESVRTCYPIEKLIVRKRISEMVKSIATKLSDE